MIIAAPLKLKFASITSNAKIEYVESSDPEIRGKVRIKGAVAYLYLQKINDDGMDTHVGAQYAETNLDVQLDSPYKMKKLGLFKNDFDEKKYTLKFASTCAHEFMQHSNQGKKSSSKASDAFSFIVSCTDNELSSLKTDEEKAKFLINSAKETLLELSNSKTDIAFKYMIVPHLKDGNPHVHVLMSTRRLDGYRPSFFRGKKHSGIIKKMRDVKFRLEEKYPFLLQMEHEDRAKTIDVSTNPNTGEVFGKDVELVNRIESITSKFIGQNFSYPQFTQALQDSGFEVVDDYLKGKQHIKIKHKDYGDDFLSIDTLPAHTKGVLELYSAYKYKANQTKTDVSLIVSKAVALINASDMSNGFEELNKKLYQELGARLVPNISKSGERKVSGWSIYLDEFDFKISAKKSGVIMDNKLKIDMDEVESINSLYQMIKKQNIQKQVTEATTNGSISIGDGRKKKIKFRFIDNTESLQDFITRFNENSRYGPSITKQMIVGNTVVSKFNQRDVCTIVGNTVETYQTDLNSALITMSIHIAKGHTKIRCTGEPNPRTQANLYLASRICGTTLLDYTPSPELVREADAMMDKEYKRLVVANRQRIKDAVAIRATDPTGKSKKVFIQTNNRMDREVDARPKLYGFLYGIHKGIPFQDFTYVQHLNDLPRAVKKRVVDDLRKDEQLSANELDSILIRAGITLEDAPPAKPPAHVPALAAQDHKPALATHSAPVVTEQEKPDQPDSLVSDKPRTPIRSPSKPGKS